MVRPRRLGGGGALEVTFEAAAAVGTLRVPEIKGEDMRLFFRSNGGFGASAPPAAELDIAISKGWRPKIVPRQLAPVLGKGDTGQMVEKHDGRSMADHLEIALAELPKWARGDYWHLDQYVEELRSEAFVAFWRPGSGELGNQAPSLMLERYIGDIGAALKTLATPILADQSVDA